MEANGGLFRRAVRDRHDAKKFVVLFLWCIAGRTSAPARMALGQSPARCLGGREVAKKKAAKKAAKKKVAKKAKKKVARKKKAAKK